jgi:surface carbohydrate biosynthesis protein
MKSIIKKKPSILLSIETKARELPGKILLSCFLAEKGYKVIITNYRKIPFALKTNAWLYIDRNSFAPRMSFFKRLKFFGFKLVCIDEEGIIWRTPELYKSRIHVKTNSYVDMYFTWGAKQAELIKQVSDSINTVETGNPRVDLMRPELTEIYQIRADSLRDKYGDFILLVSNFSINNNFYKKEEGLPILDLLIADRRRQGLITNTVEEQDFRNYYQNRERVFEKIIILLKNLSSRFQDSNIIVRPHPSENHDNWKNLMKDYPNVQIVYEGELTPWILAAKAVIHSSCTTGVEAALLKRKAIAYIPIDEPEYDADLPNRVSAAVSTENEVIELIERSPISQPVPSILEEYITSLTGPFACEKITGQIDELYKNRSLKDIIKRKILFRNNTFSKLVSEYLKRRHEALNAVNNVGIIEKSIHFKEYKKQKLERITTVECNDLLVKYRELLHRFDKIQIDDKNGYIEIQESD